MIVQSAPVILKQRNQPNRECLYAWYPEAVPDKRTGTSMGPRDIYMHKGIDKDLIQQNSERNELINDCNNSDVLQRYKQSVASSERIYHPTETIDEALKTPWALHFEVERREATPNPPSHSTDMSTRDEIPRRLKSAPTVRSLPPTSILTIPEPRFVTSIITDTTTNPTPRSPLTTRPKTRASSAKARLNTTIPASNEPTEEHRREIKSAQGIQYKFDSKLSDEDNFRNFTQAYSDKIEQQQEWSSIFPPSTYGLPKAASWCGTASPPTPTDKGLIRSKIEVNFVPLNPYYVHRSGVISVKNIDKKPVVRENKKTNKHHRRYHHHREKLNEPLLALTPISQTSKKSVEMDGIKLIYDPSIRLDDVSLNLTKYFIDGRLYLIKDQCYNVLENIDPSILDKYNQSQNLPQRPKYYQTIPIEKFQIPKPIPDVHYNANETYFYNTLPKRVHRYVIDPNFISENLNVNRISLLKRPSTATVGHSTLNDFNRQQATATVYA